MTIKLSEDEQAGFDVLREAMPEDLAIDVVKHRRRKKAHITARIARSLIREYKAFGNVEKAAELHLTRGWISFEADWARPKVGRTFHDSNNPMPVQSANYGRPEPVIQEQITEEEKERRRQMVARAREAGLIGRTMQ